MRDVLPSFLGTQLFRIPFLVAYVFGVVIAFGRVATHGKSAAFAGWGFLIQCIAWCFSAATLYWQLSSTSAGRSIREMATTMVLASNLAQALQFIGLVLIMVALFGRNDRAPVVQ